MAVVELDKMKESDPIKNDATIQCDGYHVLVEQCVSLESLYIIDLAVKRLGSNLSCAVATSQNEAKVFAVAESQLKEVAMFKGHSTTVTNIVFSPESDSLVYTSSLDGKVKLWDVRSGSCVKELKDSGLKPLTCMDVSINNRVLCAGTELVDGDSFLLFWDIRSRQLLGGYWESHTEDLTGVTFHPSEPETVATCSTDGLVNIFDLRESCEDDALQTILNTDNSISKIRWQGSDELSVMTQSEAVQIWRRDGAAPEHYWRRSDVGSLLSSPDDSYVVDVHTRSNGERFLLAGSLASTDNLSELYTLSIGDGDKKGQLSLELPLVGNRQVTRVSSYLPEDDIILTGGEGGFLCVWKRDTRKSCGQKKSKIRNKQNKLKPY